MKFAIHLHRARRPLPLNNEKVSSFDSSYVQQQKLQFLSFPSHINFSIAWVGKSARANIIK